MFARGENLFVTVAMVAGLAGCSASDNDDTGADADTSHAGPTRGEEDAGSGPASDCGGTSSGEADASDPESLPRPLLYVRAHPFPRLVIEVDIVEGMQPSQSIIEDIESVFSEILDKPGGVEVVIDEVLPARGADYAWTRAERAALAKETLNLEVDADTVKMHALFLDGYAAENDEDGSTTLGVAWSNLHIVMFKQVIERSCSSFGSLSGAVCREAEFLIWQHEIGHVIGLVENGLPLQSDHRDEEHGRHDVDEGCVMYWAYDGFDAISSVVDRLTSGAPPVEFDAACLADIEAAKTACSG